MTPERPLLTRTLLKRRRKTTPAELRVRSAALIGLALVACQAPAVEPGVGPSRLDERLQPAFAELKAALDEDADEVARAILSRLKPRCQDELSLQIVEGYERILGGRALRDSVEAWLSVEEAEGGFALSLSLKHDGDHELLLSPGYLRVEWAAMSIDTLGRQSAQVDGRVVNVTEAWVLPSGEELKLSLGVDSPRIGDSALAVRVEWKVSLGAGSFSRGGERFPAQGLPVRDGVIVRLAKELPTGAVEASELFRYALGDTVRLPALLERAVRIHPARYEAALDLLSSLEPQFSPSALRGVVPVIAWLTGTTGISASGEEWRLWLQERARAKEQTGNLELPGDSNR